MREKRLPSHRRQAGRRVGILYGSHPTNYTVTANLRPTQIRTERHFHSDSGRRCGANRGASASWRRRGRTPSCQWVDHRRRWGAPAQEAASGQTTGVGLAGRGDWAWSDHGDGVVGTASGGAMARFRNAQSWIMGKWHPLQDLHSWWPRQAVGGALVATQCCVPRVP